MRPSHTPANGQIEYVGKLPKSAWSCAPLQVLAALHRLSPGELPLPPSFGNPRAYCARQLHRWSAQYRASVPQPDPQVGARNVEVA